MDYTMNYYFIIQIFSCFFMTGIIWLVQVLIYPSFRLISQDSFKTFHGFHSNRITWIVGPIMLTELISAVLIWQSTQMFEYSLNLFLIFIIWILTGFVSVPLHNRVFKNPSKIKNFLIWTNWPRTILWTTRSVFWLFFLIKNLEIS